MGRGRRSYSGGSSMGMVTRAGLKAQQDTATTLPIEAIDPQRPAFVPRHLRGAQTDASGHLVAAGDWRQECRTLPVVTTPGTEEG